MSAMVSPRASRAATVVAGAGTVAAVSSHPSTVVVARVPVIVGGVVSSILIVCSHSATFPAISVTIKVRITTIGHVPVATSW